MSLTIQGLIIGVLAWLAKGADVPLAEGQIEVFVRVALALIAAVMIYYGRWRRGDLTIFGTRK